jgi:N-acetylmuramoyl-L-alanine amidase
MTSIPGRCHFDDHGWLQGPIEITHMLSPNRYDAGFADNARGLVQHTEDGYEAGTIATFMSPASQVSAFFAVGEDGSVTQFLPVGQGYQAWAQAAGNQAWRSCECEDKTLTGQPMTPPQIAAFAQILEACSAYDGFPLQVTDDPVKGTGLITHGDGGAAWGGHTECPGSVRKAQRPAIIELAQQIRRPPQEPVQSPGGQPLVALAAAWGTSAAAILRETIRNSAGGVMPAPLAAYVSAGDLAHADLAAGVTLFISGTLDDTVPPSGGYAWLTEGLAPLSWLAGHGDTTLALLLEATIAKYGTFDAILAAYLDAGDLTGAVIPAGAQLWVPEAAF